MRPARSRPPATRKTCARGSSSLAWRSTRVAPRRDSTSWRGSRMRFNDALAGPGLGAIAEIKRRSPSLGDIRPDADPAAARGRVCPCRRSRRVGARGRALRRRLGRPSRRARGDRCSPACQGLLLDRRAPAHGEGGRSRRRAAPAPRPRRRSAADAARPGGRARPRHARRSARRRRAGARGRSRGRP